MTPSVVFSFSAFKTWTLILPQLYRQWTPSPERSAVPVWPCPALVFVYVIKKYLLSGIITTNVFSRCSSATRGKLLLSVPFLCSNYWFVRKVCLANRSFQHIQIGSYVCGLQRHSSPHQRQFKKKRRKLLPHHWWPKNQSNIQTTHRQTKDFAICKKIPLNRNWCICQQHRCSRTRHKLLFVANKVNKMNSVSQASSTA